MINLYTVNGKPWTPSAAAVQEVANLESEGLTAKATPKGIEVDLGFAPEPVPAPAVKSLAHKPECGDVGQTGQHGDIGSNAA